MKTIHLVGDEPERSNLADVLIGLDYRVIDVQDGPSALSVIRDGTPIDIVITDCQSAGMDGLEFFASVKKLAPSVPSVILTACGSIEECLKAYSLGVLEYISKPLTPLELGKIVKAVLDGARTVE